MKSWLLQAVTNLRGLRILWRTNLKKYGGKKPQTHRFLGFSCAILLRICIFIKLPGTTNGQTWNSLVFSQLSISFYYPPAPPFIFLGNLDFLVGSGHIFRSAVPKRYLPVGGSFRPHSMKTLLRRGSSVAVLPV